MVACQMYNLQTMVYNAMSKGKKAKPKNVSEFNPYVKPTNNKAKITAGNIGILKEIGNAMCAQGVR